jgi:hypothetical protein
MGKQDSPVESYTSVEAPAPLLLSTQIQAGLDCGKLRDHSVLATTSIEKYYLGLKHMGRRQAYYDGHGHFHEGHDILKEQFRWIYTLRHMEHFELRTSYEHVAQRCGDILDALLMDMPGVPIELLIDHTGVGVAVLEIIQKEMRDRPGPSARVPLHPITLTSGTAPYKPGSPTCSKFALVSTMIARMSALVPELQIPADLEHLTATIEELRNYQEKLSQETGNASYDGRATIHDDRVIALGLSLLPPVGEISYSERLF